MGTTYSVTIDLKTVGSLDIGKGVGGGKGPEKAMSAMKSGWSDIKSVGSDVVGVLDSAVDKMASFAKWGAIAAGGAAAAGIVYGIKDLNNELESTKISLGTIFSANGIASDVPEGMMRASAVVKEMRKDAKALPGEFDDLKNVFTTGAIDAFRAGASPEQWEKLSAKVMAAAKVAQVPMEVASREFAMLLEGRAGAHNVLGTRLFGLSGDSAKRFNKEDDATRYADLSKTLDKYSGSINEFGQSFDGLSSSLIDNAKNLIRQATEPLFNVIKGELMSINQWFDDNDATLSDWAGMIGHYLVDAFRWAKGEILLWGPAVEEFAVNAYNKIHEIWVDVAPAVEKVGAAIRDALKDPGTIDKLAHLLELWIVAKTIGGVGTGIADMVKIGAGGMDIAKGMGWVGKANTAAESAGGGAAAAAGGYGLGSLALAGAIPTALAGGLYYGAFGGVPTQQDHDDDATKAGKKMANEQWDNAVKAGKSVTEIMEQSRAELGYMNANFQTVTASAYELQTAALYASHALIVAGGNFVGGSEAMNDRDRGDALAQAKAFAHPLTYQKELFKPSAIGGGHGGTSIAKVEIVVTSNQNPSRVARMVYDEFGKVARNPRSSRFTPNYSSLTPG